MNTKKYLIVYVVLSVITAFTFARDNAEYSKKDSLIKIVVTQYDQHVGTYESAINLQIENKLVALSRDSIIIRIYATPMSIQPSSLDEINNGWRSDWITIKKKSTINLRDYGIPDMKNARWLVGFYEYEDKYYNVDYTFVEFNTK